MLSAHFSAADLLNAGETWAAYQVENVPMQPATWNALKFLCKNILEPVRTRFGHPIISYGYSSPALTKLISGRIYPSLDQHAGHEIDEDGKPICKRLGQAVDFILPGYGSAKVASWIVANLPFDRLYYYGNDRPLHVSIGPDNSRSIVAMLRSPTGRLIPRRIKQEWLDNIYTNGHGV